MPKRVGLFLAVWLWAGAMGTAQAYGSRTTMGLVSWVSGTNINQVGGFVVYTHGKIALSVQLLIGQIEDYEDDDYYFTSGERLDFNGAISYRLFAGNRWMLGPFIGLKVQRLQVEEFEYYDVKEFAGAGPALGLLFGHDFFSCSAALTRNTWSNFSDELVLVGAARIQISLGNSPWRLGLGYRGESDAWNEYHGADLNFYRAL